MSWDFLQDDLGISEMVSNNYREHLLAGLSIENAFSIFYTFPSKQSLFNIKIRDQDVNKTLKYHQWFFT